MRFKQLILLVMLLCVSGCSLFVPGTQVKEIYTKDSLVLITDTVIKNITDTVVFNYYNNIYKDSLKVSNYIDSLSFYIELYKNTKNPDIIKYIEKWNDIIKTDTVLVNKIIRQDESKINIILAIGSILFFLISIILFIVVLKKNK